MKMFLEKFFPSFRTTSIRKKICDVRQHSGETLHEYRERFNKLCVTCPHHQISEHLLIQYFYEGLMLLGRCIIEATSGRALMDKTLTTTRNLIFNMNSENSNFTTNDSNFSEHQEVESMENNDRTLKELVTPDMVSSQALKGVPRGLFHDEAVGDTGRPHQDESVSILPGWSCKRLAPVLFNTLGDMKHMFLEKFFPASRTTTIRKEICGIRQHSGETLHEYWERFNKLCATCPHHQISEQLLIQYFYEGLMMMDRSMIDAASAGALMGKTLIAARHLISNMASNTQQFGTRGTIAPRMVNEVDTIDNPRLENQLTELTSLVKQLAIGQHQPIVVVKACGICTLVEHPTNMCPTLQEIESDHPERVGSIGGY
ncbi:hypothetical protein CR513_09735, partial [Mucuna pruriens]